MLLRILRQFGVQSPHEGTIKTTGTALFIFGRPKRKAQARTEAAAAKFASSPQPYIPPIYAVPAALAKMKRPGKSVRQLAEKQAAQALIDAEQRIKDAAAADAKARAGAN